ncbi:unnamed protein product [Protopolystoma xenopodis]|uniref:Uncharacterized protein n=1 Tax=Protopolystoma xenopodis TaxID=117903 RepID=A0A3S5BN84_9PLAT|nr:unnamed protein product [Protopolystoma xenopodis]
MNSHNQTIPSNQTSREASPDYVHASRYNSTLLDSALPVSGNPSVNSSAFSRHGGLDQRHNNYRKGWFILDVLNQVDDTFG